MAIEIERKFSLAEGKRITALGEDFRLGERTRESLRATYFDTEDFALARHKVTLRRRTGGHDAGWHLKLPGDLLAGGDHARQEIHSPIVAGRSQLRPPAELRDQVADIVGSAALVPVVELRTQRTIIPITTPHERELAGLCDDRVTALRRGDERSWHELEVEITGGEASDLERISTAMIEAGAEPKQAPSKLVEALGGELAAERAPLGKKSSAGEVLMAYIGEQIGVIQGREAGVRVDAPDAVHKMRVATRRLRSTLRTFRNLLDAERTEPLRAELKWLAEKLGAARDAEVLKERLLSEAAALPAEALVGPVEQRLTRELDAQHDRARAELYRAFDTRRAQVLFDNLVRMLIDPPLLPAAQQRAPKALGKELVCARQRVTKRWAAAQESDGAERMHWAHEARKKAKAARYGWEAAAPSFAAGSDVAKAWEDVTEVLGTAQDTVVARERLLEIAAVATRARESALSYGILWEREREQQEMAFDEGDAAIRAALKASKRA